MKVIGLLPFRNEKMFIPTYLSGLKEIVDLIIAVDDSSNDGGPELLRQNLNIPCSVILKNKTEYWSVDKTRQHLLEMGREAGGTHFVCLDADETFTGNFRKNAKTIFAKMEPGQKLSLQWLAMWKSVDHYREDNSVWSNNFKDFVFYDDKKHNCSNIYLCEPRTPGPSNEQTLLKLNPKYGAVFHFQFSDFRKFQLKQAWYRCQEAVKNKPILAINQKYSITLDDPEARVISCPTEWMKDITLPTVNYCDVLTQSWHYQEILSLFDKFGLNKFIDLDIWHIPELNSLREKNE